MITCKTFIDSFGISTKIHYDGCTCFDTDQGIWSSSSTSYNELDEWEDTYNFIDEIPNHA